MRELAQYRVHLITVDLAMLDDENEVVDHVDDWHKAKIQDRHKYLAERDKQFIIGSGYYSTALAMPGAYYERSAKVMFMQSPFLRGLVPRPERPC